MTDHMAVAAESPLWEYERYGVKLVNINEDFDYLALGHVEPRRFAAAFNAYFREFVSDSETLRDFTLSSFDDLSYEWAEFQYEEDYWLFLPCGKDDPGAVPYTRYA